MNELNFRQIHLDFHTSEKIAGIGSKFSKEQFQKALKLGHVNSITVFSKCHHGWAYHPSEANEIHPHLEFDLLKEMIDAAHEIDVKTPVYISAGIDEKIARKHSNWVNRAKDESTTWATSFSEAGFHVFCLNTPYLDILLAQIEEVVQKYDADGIFLDIVQPKPCYCQTCVQDRIDLGLDPYNELDVKKHADMVYANYTSKVREAIDKYKPGLPVFHNGGHIAKGSRDIAQMNTHLELESLPTGGWGYDHFPTSVRYAQNIGMDLLGMTGKFHTTWGEFGGYKHPNALRYEAALSIANGAKCSIGDQLHPTGFMDELTYKIIGEAYSEVEAKEEWCKSVKNIADVAVLSNESVAKRTEEINRSNEHLMDTGATRMLTQAHILYDVVDPISDWTQYKVLILPDTIRLTDELKAQVEAYVAQGGKILATGESGLDIDKDEFTIDLGVKWEGKCTNTPCYFKPEVELDTFNGAPFVMYSESEDVSPTTGKSLGEKQLSYFNREVFYFCSHQHTPNSYEVSGTGMVETPNSIYIAWKIFSEYATYGNLPLREVIQYALKTLLNGTETIKTNLPSQGIVTMMHQTKEDREVVHLLYATPTKRGVNPRGGQSIEIIEDLIPIYNTSVKVKTDREVKRVYLAPQMEDLDFTVSNGEISVNVEKLLCHQMIVIE